ncbi:MAG: DNA repair protein RecN [Clostridia bacterium]|nr:DNA repair protein RecN [Clostridia bacterium]
MLSGLHIKNIALIDRADIEFGEGLNVLSGETGSGKSVILDCINFVLGSKADRSMIRSGESECQVSAEFTVSEDSFAAEKLKSFDIDCDGTIVISRKYSQDGKGSIKMNGTAVTSQMLKAVTMNLVDVHGQSEHFFLLDESNQLKVIDDLCADEAAPIKEELSLLIDEKKELEKKMETLGGDDEKREREIDMLSFEIEEIEKASLKEGELDGLLERRHILNNAERIAGALTDAREAIDGDGGLSENVNLCVKKLSQISSFSKVYGEIAERAENLRIEADDLSSAISDAQDAFDYDENEAESVEQRISVIRFVTAKYGGSEKAALEYLKKSAKRLETLSSGAILMQKFTSRLKALNEEIYSLCKKLTHIRHTRAEIFCQKVEGELKTLNIPDAMVEVEFSPYDEKSATLNSKNGSDRITFLFSANKGEPMKPLGKVISGGEMSRFMLALKTQIRTSPKDISTYIFDEIDAGISGRTATTVAEKFLEIGKSTQILAVSHLPQVSAASETQFLIYKTEDGGKTVTRIKKLSKEEKIGEIVRLIGSIDSEAARTHAKDLIKQFRG